MKQLKKLAKIFLLLSLGMIYSCSSNDNLNDSNRLQEDIIGLWELVSANSNGEELIQNSSCKYEINITSDTYELTMSCDFKDGYTPFLGPLKSYNITGNDFIVTYDEFSIEYEIIELNTSFLKLKEIRIIDGETVTTIETYNRL